MTGVGACGRDRSRKSRAQHSLYGEQLLLNGVHQLREWRQKCKTHERLRLVSSRNHFQLTLPPADWRLLILRDVVQRFKTGTRKRSKLLGERRSFRQKWRGRHLDINRRCSRSQPLERLLERGASRLTCGRCSQEGACPTLNIASGRRIRANSVDQIIKRR